MFLVPPRNIEPSSDGAIAEGGEIKLWCMSETSHPAVIMHWKEDDSLIAPHQNMCTDGGFHGSVVYSEVILSALKIRNGNIVSCTPEFDGELLEELSHQFVLNVTSEYRHF